MFVDVPGPVQKPPISTLTLAVFVYDIPFEVLSLSFVTASAICEASFWTPIIFSFTPPSFREARGLKLTLNEEMTKRGICEEK